MPHLSEYAFTPRDIGHVVGWFFRRIRTARFWDWVGIALLLALGIALRTYTELGLDDIFFWVFTAWIFYFNLDARISIGCALAGLFTIPLLLFLAEKGFAFGEMGAEEVAVWVYFFLVIGVVKQVIDMIRDGRSQPSESDPREEWDDLHTLRPSKPHASVPPPPHVLIIPELPRPPLHGSPTPRPGVPMVGDGVVVVRRTIRVRPSH